MRRPRLEHRLYSFRRHGSIQSQIDTLLDSQAVLCLAMVAP
jgi:hypothetical protein